MYEIDKIKDKIGKNASDIAENLDNILLNFGNVLVLEKRIENQDQIEILETKIQL